MGELIFRTGGLRYAYPGAAGDAVRDISLDVPAAELTALVGPNGSGKTTLLRLLLGVLRPAEGTALALGRPAHAWRRRDLARRIAVVVQREEPTFPLKVRQAVRLGRYPHLGPLERFGPDHVAAVERALERCDAVHLADRWTATLSGGEWQRVRLARALAQEPEVLVLDEPTANLDIRHEMEVFELVARQVRDAGLTGVIVTHHVNLAARFADRIVILDRGRATAVGTPDVVMTRDVMERVFEWPVEVMTWRGTPQVVPLRRDESSERRNLDAG
jgi:iron complex transport system ATP-binding protein